MYCRARLGYRFSAASETLSPHAAPSTTPVLTTRSCPVATQLPSLLLVRKVEAHYGHILRGHRGRDCGRGPSSHAPTPRATSIVPQVP